MIFALILFSPFIDSQIPCINSGKRDLSGKTFVKNNQKCTDIDFKVADTLIVNWDTSTTKFTSGYTSEVTLAERHYKTAKDLVVSIDADSGVSAGGQRKCQFCPPGKYMRKRKNNAIFKRNNCEDCPKGMISARVTEDAKLFIPDDVKKLTEQYFPDTIFPAVDYVAFGCRACSVQTGVPQKSVCTQCQQNAGTKQYEQYQHAEKVEIGSASLQFFLVVGTECKFCPPGYEYYNRKAGSDKTPCRSMNGVLDCCRICLPNSFSDGNGARYFAISVYNIRLSIAKNEGFKSCAIDVIPHEIVSVFILPILAITKRISHFPNLFRPFSPCSPCSVSMMNE